MIVQCLSEGDVGCLCRSQGDYRVGIAGNVMKGDLQERISRACNIAIEADTVNDDDGKYYE